MKYRDEQISTLASCFGVLDNLDEVACQRVELSIVVGCSHMREMIARSLDDYFNQVHVKLENWNYPLRARATYARGLYGIVEKYERRSRFNLACYLKGKKEFRQDILEWFSDPPAATPEEQRAQERERWQCVAQCIGDDIDPVIGARKAAGIWVPDESQEDEPDECT